MFREKMFLARGLKIDLHLLVTWQDVDRDPFGCHCSSTAMELVMRACQVAWRKILEGEEEGPRLLP